MTLFVKTNQCSILTSMRKDKEYIFSLRKEGKTYRQIQKEVVVSRATLSAWFKDIEWNDIYQQKAIAPFIPTNVKILI